MLEAAISILAEGVTPCDQCREAARQAGDADGRVGGERRALLPLREEEGPQAIERGRDEACVHALHRRVCGTVGSVQGEARTREQHTCMPGVSYI